MIQNHMIPKLQRASNTVLHQYLINRGQGGTQNNRQKRGIRTPPLRSRCWTNNSSYNHTHSHTQYTLIELDNKKPGFLLTRSNAYGIPNAKDTYIILKMV